MGQYRSAVITDAGQALLADAISGSGTVTFSAIKTSSYAYPQGTNIAGLTDLQDIVQTVTPFSVQVFNDTMLQVSARFDNSDVASAYLIQTLGAYAQIGDNDPVLFAVVQANTPDQMPMQSPVSPSAFIYNIQITVQQASQITVTVNPAGTATVQDILTLSAQKVDVNGGELAETETIFDDSGSVSGITSFPAFLATFLSKTKTGIFLRNLKAGLQFVLHVGSIVNNCVTDNAELPLSAAQGKVLMDLYTVLNTKLKNFLRYEDVNLTATTDHFVTMTLSNPSQYKIPVLINPGSNNWEISVGWQYSTNILNLTGPGVAKGYVYTVRVFYFTL